MNKMFTVGHSNHALDHFMGLLAMHGVSAIADVRSSPHSEYTPQFNREVIERVLRDAGVEYVFLGKELGARRGEERCYVDGQAKYALIKDLPQFRAGLDRLFEGVDQYVVALMCAEADPITCHRTILICHEVKALRPDIAIAHILGDGRIESHKDAEERLIQLHKLQPELFGDLTTRDGLLEEAYHLQAEKIAYKKTIEEP